MASPASSPVSPAPSALVLAVARAQRAWALKYAPWLLPSEPR